MMICEFQLYSCRGFISDVCHRPPDEQHHVLEFRKPSKALGDPPALITTQSLGVYAHDFSASDLDAFMTLAKRYIFEGRDRSDICAYNSGVKPVYHCVVYVFLNYFIGCFFSWSRICRPILAATRHCINEIYSQFVTQSVSFSISEDKHCVHPFQSSTIPSRFFDFNSQRLCFYLSQADPIFLNFPVTTSFARATSASNTTNVCPSWSTWLDRIYLIKPPLCTPTRVTVYPFEHKCESQFTKHRGRSFGRL